MSKLAAVVMTAFLLTAFVTVEANALEECAHCLANAVQFCSEQTGSLSGESCFEKRAGHCYEVDRCDSQADSHSIFYRCAAQKLCRDSNTQRKLETAARARRCGDTAACRDQADAEERDVAEDYAACFDQSVGAGQCQAPLSF